MRLVITEKPSVARDLARVLGVRVRGEGFLGEGELVITWCRGHLLELEAPAHYDPQWKPWRLDTLPMVPERFELRPRKGAMDQWRVVKRLLRQRDLEAVVNACDAGREGELIFRYAYQGAGCRAPVQRLWVSSMTDRAIQEAWARLRPGRDYDRLGDSARCRSEADWLVGLNATRALTCLARSAGGDQLLSVGRVQTPTLAMIVQRDREIEAFEPEPFWQVRARFRVGEAQWTGAWFQVREPEERGQLDQAPRAERLPSTQHAEAVAAATQGRAGTIEQAQTRRKREAPPLLYDLTSLQRRANQRYGMPADRTLALAQDLYEKHKLITYPRTDARHLTPDQVPELPGIVEGVGGLRPYAAAAQQLLAGPIAPGRRVVDAEEVGDHHAIIPTGRTPNPSRLGPDEKRVYDLIARRFLAALSPDAVFDHTTIVVAVPPGDAPLPEEIAVPLRYRARGKVIVEEGWRAIDPPPKRKQLELPRLEPDATAQVLGTEVKEGATRPPSPFNDASILKSMETAGKDLDDAQLKRAMRSAGLGTPATRANILQTLIHRGFIERKGKTLRATDRGRGLIDVLPVDALKSAELTGRWEARLSAMADGKDRRAEFMEAVVAWTTEVIEAIKAAPPPPPEVVRAPDTPVLGDCPVCGKPVREGRAAFSCETGRACSFVIFKKVARRQISPGMVKALLRHRRSTRTYKGFRSKKGKPFEAGLELDEEGKVVFWFPERERSRPETPVGLRCPQCGLGQLVAGRAAWGCDRWREGCDYRIPFDVGSEAAVTRVLGS